MPDFKFERTALIRRPGAVIAGIDEAGRGPWAGPVVAAAVVFDIGKAPQALCEAIDDSKKLNPSVRERLCAELLACPAASVGVGRAEVEEIDRLNILKATFLAMGRALDDLKRPVDHALIDGNRAPPLPCTVEMLVKGDSRSLSIAAASIVAKVTRDRLMRELARQYPGYGWDSNAGYGTPEHQDAVTRLGVTPHHRRSFAPVRARLAAEIADD
ncbi:MAG: ribonuclease HII [Rhodospirillaceae bacterium]|nr:ribonuclease HII [Rhodospirillaceae bacterium]